MQNFLTRLGTCPMRALIEIIQGEAQQQGLTLSRWQSNLGDRVRVVYAVHAGERSAQPRFQAGVQHRVTLDQLEGRTPASAAYRVLAGLLADMQTEREVKA